MFHLRENEPALTTLCGLPLHKNVYSSLAINATDDSMPSGVVGYGDIRCPACWAAWRTKFLVRSRPGQGVGATLEVWHGDPARMVGRLIFHEQGDWQVGHSEDGIDWSIYEEALRQARKEYPGG